MPSLEDILVSAFRGLATALDTPRAMAWQVPRWLAGGDSPLEVALNPEKRMHGSDLAAALGYPDSRALAIGSELALDPLNAFALGRLAKLAALGKEPRALSIARYSDDLGRLVPRETLHSVEDLRGIAAGAGDVRLYHGTPTSFADKIVREGFQMPQSGEAVARNVASAYDIPWTEWKHRVEPEGVGAGYGAETSRISTAASPIAARWASHFPQGEVQSMLNDKARLYSEAKRRGYTTETLEEQLGAGPLGRLLDKAGIEDRLKTDPTGNLLELTVDARAVGRGTRGEARRLLKHFDEGEIGLEELLDAWNSNYRDIKVAPQNVKSVRVVTHRPPSAPEIRNWLAGMAGYNAARIPNQWRE